MSSNSQKKVSIIGCGWLGFSLGKFLLEKSYRIYGTTTTNAKLAELENAGIKAFYYDLNQHNALDIESLLNSDFIIFNLPPTHLQKPLDKAMKDILKHTDFNRLKTFIFISSTSVYGETDGHVDENTPLNPQSDNAHKLIAAEKELLISPEKIVILRPAGLISADRNPGRFLAGKKGLNAPLKPVNLIHREDVIEIIYQMMLKAEKDKQNKVFNLCMDEHPTRKDFYAAAAKKMQLDPPEFSEDNGKSGKIIQNEALKLYLNYEFKYKNPFSAL